MNFLLVPTSAEALLLPREQAVREAAADFSRLPFRTRTALFNPENANLSENVVAQPFNDANLWLQPGVHLTWSLPDALTHALSDGSGSTRFPQLPNRWLVLRTLTDGSTRGWIVESDYLWPEGEGEQESNVTVPWVPDPALGQTFPFRFAGRSVPLDQWREDPDAERLPSLIAPGYGIPDFLSSYPNSGPLFGLFDNTLDDLATSLNGASYQILGWYSDRRVDPIALWSAGKTPSGVVSGLAQAFGWTLDGTASSVPEALLVFSKLELNTSAGLAPSVPSVQDLSFWAGNAASEALAAFCASAIDPDNAVVLEEQLDALQLGTTATASGSEDTAFDLALHRQGFRPHGAGTQWQLAAADGSQVSPPDPLADLLLATNLLQQQYDRSSAEIDSWRERTFADWYKYMVSKFPPDLEQDSYPDPDLIQYLLTRQDLVPLASLLSATGRLTVSTSPVTQDFLSASATGDPTSVAALLASALTALASSAGSGWALRPHAASPYLAPAEPVLLFTGAATLSVGAVCSISVVGVPCQLLALTSVAPTAGSAATAFLASVLSALLPALLVAGTYRWTRQPWLPVSMEWQTEILPLADSGQDPVTQGFLSPTYLSSNFLLSQGPDLTLRPDAQLVERDDATFSGTCLLSEHGPASLIATLVTFISQTVLPAYFLAESIPPAEQAGFDLIANLAAVTAWFVQTHSIDGLTPAEQALNLEYTALRALRFALSAHALTQQVAGFNNALLMFRQSLQLGIADPLSLPSGVAFTALVDAAVAGRNRVAPVPENLFLPLRAGAMRFGRLRLVDRFGQILEIESPDVRPARTLFSPELDPGLLYLAPRLTQNARLTLNWIDNRGNEIASVADHTTSPICGWLLPNYLDGTLLLYGEAGDPLGALSQDSAEPWQRLPSAPQRTSPLSIGNPHLQRLVRALIGHQQLEDDFLPSLLEVMEQNAPLQVEGPGAQPTSLPLMMGRPLAIVRLRLSWTVKGLLALDQSWNSFREDLSSGERSCWRVDQVELPVALGDDLMPSNGIVGFWLAGGDTDDTNTFYAPLYPSTRSAPPSKLVRVPSADASLTIPVSLSRGPLDLIALVDPRAPLYLRSGLAPEQTLQLSPAVYSAAMQSLALTFYSGPIVTPAGILQITLPSIAGSHWQFSSTDTAVSAPESPVPYRTDAVFSGARVVREGWCTLRPGNDLPDPSLVNSSSRS